MTLAYKKQALFALVFGIVVYLGYKEAEDTVTNYKRGIFAAAAVLVAQGCMSQYIGPFTRGFEAFWRGVSRYTVLYLAALIFILFQTANDARGLFKYLYPELGVQVTRGMHTYDDNCEFELKNILSDLDHYYIMHLVGWFVATLMIRDPYILHFWSILDEILELSWQHILPHFRECWWDHIIVDVLGSNTPAILLGMFFIKKTGLREFDWLGRKGKKSIREWDLFQNHRRFGCVIALILVVVANFLCGFFIINSLWIPPVNFLNVYRLSVWFLLGSMSIGELHDDVETWGTEQRRKTPISNEYRWIVCGVITLETVISWKFRHDTGNILDNPTPLYISIPWIITIASIIIFYLYLRFRPNRTTKYGDSAWEIEQRRQRARLEKGDTSQKKSEKKAEIELSKQKQEEQVKKTESKKSKAQAKENQEEEPTVETKNRKEQNKKVVEPSSPDVTEQRKNWNKKKAGEVVEASKPSQKLQPTKIETFAPEESEWRVVGSTNPGKKSHKKKKD